MRSSRVFLAAACLVALSGCDWVESGFDWIASKNKPRPIEGEPSATYEVPIGDPNHGPTGPTASITVSNCTACHGTPGLDNTGSDPLVAVAPPRSVTGGASDPVIGAHRAHLQDGPFRKAVECASCHLLPTVPSLPHPQQDQRKVTFSRLATTAWPGEPAKNPLWDGSTCSSTYCHGNFRNGTASNAPSWAGGPAACGSCHGLPPGGTHPAVAAGTSCASCHGGSYTSSSVDLALHMNGVVDSGSSHPANWKDPDQHGLAALSELLTPCTACHIGYTAAGFDSSSSCNDCHASPSAYGPYTTGAYPNHPSWQTECTFCHGAKDNTTGAPPRDTHAISTAATQPTTLATIGAHSSHVQGAHSIALALDCTACHETRWTSAADPGHVDKATADVFFNDVGTTANPGSYARPDCSSTYCHGNFTGGAGTGPIRWTGTFGPTFTLSCTSCHGQPPGPTSATVHHPPNPTCGSCHNFNASTHVNGTVEHNPATGCTQCHGDLTASAVPSGDARAAPASSTNAVDAHGDAATLTSARGVGAHAKHVTGTTWRASPIACNECHAVPSNGDVAHANGNPAIAFGALASTAWTGEPALTPTWNGAGGAPNLTCSSTYCHGAFKNGANATPTWATPSTVTCGSCHAVSTTNGAGGTHPSFGTGKTCGSCHGGSYTNTAVDPALHMNGALDVANLTCSSCHGDPNRTPVASATASDALGANLVKDSPPADAGHGTAATGAHLAHVNQGDTAAPGALSNALACSSCHAVPTSTSHSNGSIEVAFSGLATAQDAVPSPYDLVNHRCASTYCHGNFTGGNGANAILWTATGKLACSSCHGAPPGPTSATLHHPPNPTCASCHANYTATTVAVATHVNGTAEHTPATGCTQCHGDLQASAVANTDVRAAPASDASAVDAHGNAATTTSARGVGAHARHLTGTTWRASPIACGECHAVPATGDVTHANGSTALAFGALASTAWAGQPAITPVWNGAGGATTLTCSSTYCHGAFKNGNAASPTWATPSTVSCGSCHGLPPAGTHPTIGPGASCGSCHGGTYTATSVDPDLHMNGALDGGGESGGGLACSGCHSALFSGMTGGSHASKHSLGSLVGTNDSPTDSGITWTNPLSSNAAAQRSCVNMCHGDHPHDLTSPSTATHENNAYVDASSAGTRSNGSTSRVGSGGTGTQNRTKTDHDAAQANGGLCTSCHSNPVDATRPAVAPAAYDASAHSGTRTNGAIAYDWSYQLHDGGLFTRDCTKCHASDAEGTTPAAAAGGPAVHFGDNASLLAGTTNPAGTAAGFVCYNCHGSTASPAAGAQGNRSGKDIQSQIVHATTAGQSGHPADSDTVHDSAAEYASATFGNALGAVQRHANCLDCHDPHQAKSGTHTQGTSAAGPPLQGAWGARLATNPAFWTAPTSASFVKTTITSGTEPEATLCFKCHSSYYGTLPTAPSSSPAFAETDVAKEFNPANVGNWAGGSSTGWQTGETAGSFHPILASAGGNLGVTNNLKAPWTTTSRMTCSDCHASDTTTDPNGPHGSAAKFVLKGPATAWNNTILNGLSMPSTVFCSNCHNTSWGNSRFQAHNVAQHAIPCFNCHSAVPHGAPRPGFLNPIAGADSTSVSAFPDYDNAAPYAQPNAGYSAVYLLSYPAYSNYAWSPAYCGCNSATLHR